MTDYMICQNQDNHLLYALKHGRFWFWDEHQTKWVPSDFAAQQYAKAQTKEPDLTQEDWLGRCFGILMDDYEVPDAVVKALRALSNKEEPPCKVNTTAPNADAAVTMAAPAATLAEETSTTQADANSCPPGPCSPAGTSAAISSPSGAAAACSAPAFDYSGLDEQTVNDLHLAERECAAGRRLAEAGLRRMADGVAIAHETLVPNWDNSKHGNRGEDAFRRWCESIGVSKSAAYRLLQVTALFDNSSPEQQKILDSLSPSLLYAAAKPSPPADLVQAVKSGDITTHKQYQDLLKENQQLRADRVNALNAAAAAEAMAHNDQAQLLALLARVRAFHSTAVDLPAVQVALSAARRSRAALRSAQTAQEQAQMYCRLLEERLPQGELPDPAIPLPRPSRSVEAMRSAIPEAQAQLATARTRLDTISGQLQATLDPSELTAQLAEKRRRLAALQAEYEAIQLAMDTLSAANQTLQNRFSPALGARTAEIFSALTGGRYDKVLLDRTLALSAEPSGDPTPRSIQVLSQGAADQLYLAVRLAICQLVLPPEKHVPLILDDVFASFDDQRLAAALEWLLQESQNRQILLFTCHDRERTYLAGRPGVHILTLNGGTVCSR